MDYQKIPVAPTDTLAHVVAALDNARPVHGPPTAGSKDAPAPVGESGR